MQLLRHHLLEKNPRTEGIAQAAWQLEDAIQDRLARCYPSSLDARRLHFEAAEADKDSNRALMFLILLTVLETPTWCNTTDGFWSYVDSSERCVVYTDKGTLVPSSDVYLSTLPYIPPGWGLVVEFVCIFVFARKLLLDAKLQIKYFQPLHVNYNSMKLMKLGLAFVILEIIDIIVFIVFRPKMRFAFISRSGYLMLLPAVVNLGACVIAVINEFVSIAAFLGGTVIFFAWIAVTVFADYTDENGQQKLWKGKPVNEGLESFASTLNTMFIAGATEEFIECFLPTYTDVRKTGLLWLLFLIIVQVLLLNLVLDTLVAAYTNHQETAEEESVGDRVDGIFQAYDTLVGAVGDGDDVSETTFLEFVKEFSASPNIRDMPPETAEIIFRAIDVDGGGSVDRREFCDICGILEYDFWITRQDSPVKEVFPRFWNSRGFAWFRKFVHDGKFDSFMNYVLLVNLGLVILETYNDLNGLEESSLTENMELLFSFIYVFEVGLNMCVFSWGEYSSNRANQFDFFCTWALLFSSFLDKIASEGISIGGGDLKRYMNILRLLRLLRVIKQLKRLRSVQLMIEIISKLVVASRDILTLLGVVLFFFATLSIQLWGGILYHDRPELKETAYDERDFYVFNFNDFGSSVGVWFIMLLCEYIAAFPDAVWRTSNIIGSWWVFPVFYVCGVSIVFELVKAFTIEVFLELHGKAAEKKKKEKERKENGGAAEEEEVEGFALDKVQEALEEGRKLHFRVIGETTGHEKVVLKLKEMEEERERAVIEAEEEEEDREMERRRSSLLANNQLPGNEYDHGGHGHDGHAGHGGH